MYIYLQHKGMVKVKVTLLSAMKAQRRSTLSLTSVLRGMSGERHATTASPPGKRPDRPRLKCDGTRAETRFRLSAKRMCPFKSAGASVQSTTGRRAVHISLQGLYCSCKPLFCSHVTLTGYPLHSLVSPSLLLPCLTMCHHISTGLYLCYPSVPSWHVMGWTSPSAFFNSHEHFTVFRIVGSDICRATVERTDDCASMATPLVFSTLLTATYVR